MAKQSPFSDHQTLQGLKEHNNYAFEILYTFYYPMVERFVLNNSGTSDQAKDVFQETILVLLRKVPQADFELTSSLKTYVFSVASNLWLKRLREAKKVFHTDFFDFERSLQEWETTELLGEPEKTTVEKLGELLSRITVKCQTLLKAIFFFNKNIRQITSENGYTTVHNARNQKYKCLEQARNKATR